MMKRRSDNSTPPLDVLIFDMDGVLIDVSKSYRKTIEKTIQIYLKICLGSNSGRDRLVLDKAISHFKAAGGFNNDWDLTSGLLTYLLSASGFRPSSKRKTFSSIPETIACLRRASLGSTCTMPTSINSHHLLSFLEKVKAAGGGLKGIHQALQSTWDGWIYGSGDLDRDNLVKRIFQEVYLGKKFTSCYALEPLFYRGKGYYLQEKMLIPMRILSALSKKLQLGIASGRPRFEAELALRRFHLLPFFKSVVTLDECLEEEDRLFRSTGRRLKRTKPHPFPLRRAVQEIGIPRPQCGYVGDVVDDIVAARALGKRGSVLAIGFVRGTRDITLAKALKQAGADRVIRHPRELLQLVTQA